MIKFFQFLVNSSFACCLAGLLMMFAETNICVGQQVDFAKQIRPILSRHCLACHGPDEGHRESGLRLDTFAGASESAIIVGEPEASELILRVTTDDEDVRMPPAEHGKRLSTAEVDLLRAWIKAGAKYELHWAFSKPARSDPPQSPFSNWTFNEIDGFIAKRMEQQKLSPSVAAAPHRLIRRLALDLTGLPPRPQLVKRYADNPTVETYEQIVDQLLASSAYGEHWAAMWLDIARYADTTGYAEDRDRTIWPWRDWVIDAFNRNLPYDQFTVEQIAGDLLADPTDSQLLATAFHRNTLSNSEGGTSDEEFRTIAVKDRISTTVNVWMGLTMRCAECHTHKYDPISQTEYYQFLAFFNQTEDADRNDEQPTLAIHPPGRETEIAALDDKIAALKLKKADSTDLLKKQIAQLQQQKDAAIHVPIMRELPADQQRSTHVMVRGSYLNRGDEVESAVMNSFHSLPANAPANRLGVAHWLMSDENPLTARVTVNRFWSRIFGVGIVETEEDFGTQGSLPSHPDLLDWLAIDFREHGWDIKRLLKQMVMSATYRQSNKTTPEQLEKDPRNLMYSRGPRVRLRAEVVRDQALAVSGLLSKKMYGPPVYPPNPVKRTVNAFTGGKTWTVSPGEDRYRRAIYTYLKRSQPHPLFDTFDMATREVCNMRRIRTNTPLQSFMTLNDEVFMECARKLALQMKNHSEEVDKQLSFGLELALVRPAEQDQIQILQQLFDKTHRSFLADARAARQFAGIEEDKTSPDALAELATLTVVANVILNLDSFLTK